MTLSGQNSSTTTKVIRTSRIFGLLSQVRTLTEAKVFRWQKTFLKSKTLYQRAPAPINAPASLKGIFTTPFSSTDESSIFAPTQWSPASMATSKPTSTKRVTSALLAGSSMF